METNWISREVVPTAPLSTAVPSAPLPSTDYPSLIYRFLISRGFSSTELVNKFLSPKLGELKDPALILNMSLGVERLVKAFKDREKVCVYADFDLDGTSGLALMIDGLKQLGFQNLVQAQPKRLSDGYGFHTHIVEDLKSQGVSVIITVDVGITAFEAVSKSNERGIDVILTDHHQPKATVPAAFAVINPNQAGDTSGLGYLCGAGVAFYFLRALKRGLVNQGLISESALDLKSLLDCLCIATLTDMVPLVDDNRALVKAGLHQLEKTTRPGLRALLESLEMAGRPLSGQDVAIRFAPKLNALSRMEMGILPIDIYQAESLPQANVMVKTVLKNNSTRVQLQSEGEAEAQAALATWPHKKFVIMISPNFHKGVVGLIATKISQQQNVPAFIGAINSEGVVTGSGRLPPGYSGSLLPALDSVKEHLNRFGGHDAAAGFEFHSEKLQMVVDGMADFFESGKFNEVAKSIVFDVNAELSEINEQSMKWMEALGPFGQSFSNPIFCFRDLVVREVNSLKGGHLKMKLEDLEGFEKMDGLYFSPPESFRTKPVVAGEQVDILAEVQWNYFAGRKTLQLLIKDCQIAQR